MLRPPSVCNGRLPERGGFAKAGVREFLLLDVQRSTFGI
jgi:hypothetical protein